MPLTVALLLGDQMITLFPAETNTVTDILVAQIFGSFSCTWIEGYEGFQDPHKAKWLSTRIVPLDIHIWSALKEFFHAHALSYLQFSLIKHAE